MFDAPPSPFEAQSQQCEPQRNHPVTEDWKPAESSAQDHEKHPDNDTRNYRDLLAPLQHSENENLDFRFRFAAKQRGTTLVKVHHLAHRVGWDAHDAPNRGLSTQTYTRRRRRENVPDDFGA